MLTTESHRPTSSHPSTCHLISNIYNLCFEEISFSFTYVCVLSHFILFLKIQLDLFRSITISKVIIICELNIEISIVDSDSLNKNRWQTKNEVNSDNNGRMKSIEQLSTSKYEYNPYVSTYIEKWKVQLQLLYLHKVCTAASAFVVRSVTTSARFFHVNILLCILSLLLNTLVGFLAVQLGLMAVLFDK